jgi:peptidoglycan/xylan/chitin deacetylase (PgdA/CDA1 family)
MTGRLVVSVDVDHFPGSNIGIKRIMDILDEKGIKAMFFIAGKFAEENENVIKEIYLKGHEIGCHGYSHGLDVAENFVDLNIEEQKRRIERSSKILKDITGQEVNIFRAPYAKANHRTIRVLESLGYKCDSSVTSMRFDFGMGVGNNMRAFFAPRRPYYPSLHNLFKEGESKVLEIPISAFVVPLTMSTMRTLGRETVKHIFNMSSHFFNPVVFYLHPWEVMSMAEIKLWEGLPKRHMKNRGEEALSGLKSFLDYINKKSEIILYKDILEGESHYGR